MVEPRGGAIWIGNLIEICAGVGISETLVRTAVSVSSPPASSPESGGRRSFYRLTDAARAEFAAAAQGNLRTSEEASWHFVQLMGSSAENGLQVLRALRVNARLAPGSRSAAAVSSAIMPAVVFRAEPAQGASELKAFASAVGPRTSRAGLRRFLACFGRLAIFRIPLRRLLPLSASLHAYSWYTSSAS